MKIRNNALLRIVLLISLSLIINFSGFTQKVKTSYVDAFTNTNHPQVAYWFFAANMLPEKAYKDKIDSFAQYSKYTLVFLTERDGCDFYDIPTMHPIFEKLVAYAHKKGLQIGLQLWKNDRGTLLENTDRLIQETELVLDDKGMATCSVKARGARNMNTLIKSEPLAVYAFRKTSEGFYDSATLKVITPMVAAKNGKETMAISIDAGEKYKGYTAYLLTQHYYQSCSNFSQQATDILLNAFKAYGDIPFDGIGLDEYKNMMIARQKVLEAEKATFRERVYSLGMAKQMQETRGLNLDRVLFDMRFAPDHSPTIRIRAINEYFSLFRTATLPVEEAMYELGKKLYGPNTFIGLHNTFHNNMDRDEVWQTGVTWWRIKRDYGHSDENTPTPIQLGIGMSYPAHAMYNMFYDKSLEKIGTKALYDLRFGIRTHYHAANDVQGWGVSIDAPEALKAINKVENAARLQNRFNPPFPKARLLVIFGMEALCNWYPNPKERGMYDINDKLGFENKVSELWKEGYLNAAVPSDLITNGLLTLDQNGKPFLNGNEFDAIIFLNPQYARQSTIDFIRKYVERGGKLLVEGKITHDFLGNDISAIWQKIADQSVATSFSLVNVAKLGVAKNALSEGVKNADNSFTFTSMESLLSDKPVSFSFTSRGNTYTGVYKGLASILLHKDGSIARLAATGFSSFSKNGKTIVRLSAPADIFLTGTGGQLSATLADTTKSITVNQWLP